MADTATYASAMKTVYPKRMALPLRQIGPQVPVDPAATQAATAHSRHKSKRKRLTKRAEKK